MFRSLSYDHHHGSITVLVQLLLIGVHTSSCSGLWPYVVRVSVRTTYLSFNYASQIFLTCEVLNVNVIVS
jgi:hypothetical protein